MYAWDIEGFGPDWSAGHRNPTPENLAALADALERRGGELQALAKELREAAAE